MQIEIEPLTEDNLKDLLVLRQEYRLEMTALAHEAPRTAIEQDKENLLEFLHNNDYCVFLAKSVRGHPLGYLEVFESVPYLPEKDGIINEIYVRDFYRRRKIAKKLVNQIKTVGAEKKWRRLLITLPMLLPFDAAQAFFEQQGFSGASPLKQWYVIQK